VWRQVCFAGVGAVRRIPHPDPQSCRWGGDFGCPYHADAAAGGGYPLRRIRNASPGVQFSAAVNRVQPPLAEAMLWDVLRNKQVAGLRFRRQHPVGRYVLDFNCPACQLVIELDGPYHSGQRERDKQRDAELAAHGCTIFRFSNQEVLHDIGSIVRSVEDHAARYGRADPT